MTERIQRYNVARLFIAVGLLGVTIAGVASGGWALADDTHLFFRLITLQLVLLVASAAWTRARHPGEPFLYAMFALDVAGASALSAVTGGANSLLVYLYFPVIAAGAFLLRRTGALVVAAISAAGLLLVWFVWGDPEADPLLAYWEIGFRILSFFLVALLVGQLAESLERTGQELLAQRVASETVVERVRAGVIIADLSDRITEVNPSARLLLGDIVGRRISEVFAGAIHHRAWEELTSDQRRLVCSQASLPDQGRVVVIEDVTDLWEMRERAQRDERLVAVGRLSAGLAHEIRNPLASITAVLQLLREDRPSRQVDLALGEAERLGRLVDDFLQASRATDLRTLELDVAGLARLVAEAFAEDPRFIGRVRMELDLAPVQASVDPDRLRQVLWNLVINAAQSMPEGGVVELTVRAEGPGVLLRVRDHGIGMPPEELPKIFDPFYTRRAGGTGLGLAVVDQLVRAHGGTIGVDSTPGVGTAFTIHLPLGAA